VNSSRVVFNTALGLTDGLLTALILAAGALTGSARALTLSNAFEVAAAGGLSGSFTLFVSEYSRLRFDLSRSARELNLSSARPLVSSRLGRQVLRQALFAAFIGSACSFIGALIPLTPGALWPQAVGLPLLIAGAALALLGGGLGWIVGGRRIVWAAALVVVGGVITAIGVSLNIVR
jgi:predicted membrane protein (TIGR00267 family)